MQINQTEITINTSGRGTTEITGVVASFVGQATVTMGVMQVFLRHTSASLIVCENADPAVRRDLETVLAGLAPDADARFEHDAEGPDDMAAHVRTMLTQSALSLPVVDGRLGLGTWQGIYLYEHRTTPHARSLVLTVLGK